MNNVLSFSKKSLTYAVVASTIAWSLGLSMLLVPLSASAALPAGANVKVAGIPEVSYVGSDIKLYKYQHERVLGSWFGTPLAPDFSSVVTVAAADYAAMTVGGWVMPNGRKMAVKRSLVSPVIEAVFAGKFRAFSSEEAWKAALGPDAAKYTFDTSWLAVPPYNDAAKQGAAIAVSADVPAADASPAVGLGLAAGTTPVPGNVTVSLDASNPPSTTFVAGQASARAFSLSLMNSGTVDEVINLLRLRLFGVAGDTTPSAISISYGDGSIAAEEATVSDRVVTWSNPNIKLKPGTTQLFVQTNIAASTNGQTLGFELASDADITLKSGTKVAGTYSVKGSLHQIASASLATVAFATSTTPSPNTSLDPQEGFTAFQNTLTIGTRKVELGGSDAPIIFQVIGSADKKKDLKNWKLTFDGNQFGSTLEYADDSGYLVFKQDAKMVLETGSRIAKVIVDVVGGANLNFQVRLRKAAHFLAKDSNFTVYVLVTGDGTLTTNTYSEHISGLQTVALGSLVFSRHSSSPTSNVVLRGSNIVLATFEAKSTGQKRRVTEIRAAVDSSATGTAFELQNGRIMVSNEDDATKFTQVGSTATLPEIADTSTSGYRAYALGSSVVVDVSKPRLFQVVADILDSDATDDTAANQTLIARLAVGVSNVDALVSGGVESSPLAAVTGNTRTIVTGSMVLSKDQSYGNQSKVVPANDVILSRRTATSATPDEGINLNTAQVDAAVADEWAVGDVDNLYLRYWNAATPTSVKTTSVRSAGAVSQSWSISETLAPSASMVFELRGNIQTAAVVTETTPDTYIASLLLTGTTANSGQAVNTNGNAVLAGQTITALLRENINVSLEATTTVSHQRVAGTTDAEPAVKVKVAAGTRGGGFITRVAFRVDANADDGVLNAVSLWKAVGSGAFTQVGLTKSWNADGATNPGFVDWDLSGSERIELLQNGTVILAARSTYVSSSEVAITAQTPALYLADLKVEGSSAILTPNGTGANLIVNSGLILASTTTSTFAADATATALGAALTATATAVTANAAPTTDQTGNWAFIDQDDDATYDPGEEVVYVAEGGTGDATLVFIRGAFGTVAAAADSGDNIYFVTGAKGNAMNILRNKLSVAVAATSPSGATTGGSSKLIGRIVFYAADNSADPGDNAVLVNRYDLTVEKSASTVVGLVTYPTANALNAAYASACGAVSTTKWRCVPSSTGGANQVAENGSLSVDIYANTGFSGAGAIQVSIPTPGTSSASTNDVSWDDALVSGNNQVWLDQSAVYLAALTTTSASGSPDTTAPTITGILFTNVLTAGTIANTDTVQITFSEVIDGSTIAAALAPGSSAIALDGGDGDVAVTSDGAGGNDTMTITGIATGLVLGTNLSASATYTPTGALNTAGTVFTITLAGASATPTITAANGAGTQGTGVTDANGNAMAAVATPAPTGSF